MENKVKENNITTLQNSLNSFIKQVNNENKKQFKNYLEIKNFFIFLDENNLICSNTLNSIDETLKKLESIFKSIDTNLSL